MGNGALFIMASSEHPPERGENMPKPVPESPESWIEGECERSLPPGAALLLAILISGLFWSWVAWVVLT
jgi:hypothetical protein